MLPALITRIPSASVGCEHIQRSMAWFEVARHQPPLVSIFAPKGFAWHGRVRKEPKIQRIMGRIFEAKDPKIQKIRGRIFDAKDPKTQKIRGSDLRPKRSEDPEDQGSDL
jgi:hypothetical protein